MQPKYFSTDELRWRLEPLLAPRTGIMCPAQELAATPGAADLFRYGVPIHNPGGLSSSIATSADGALTGAGAGLERDLARNRACCEAVERYCNYMPPQDLIIATRNELGDTALDLELFPRCTPAEYALPRNTLREPRNDLPLRWTRGYSLISGAPLWVPAIAVYLGLRMDYPGEGFLIPISTGTALGASYEQALVIGICEVIERDALSLTWLHQLPLPELLVEELEVPGLAERMARVRAAGIEQRFYDATSDLGVPTLYALQIDRSGAVHTLVMAATRMSGRELFNKVIDESAASRYAIENMASKPLPFDPADYSTFRRLTDGATLYADPRTSSAFDFLRNTAERRPASSLAECGAADPALELERLTRIFAERGLELAAVDLGTPATKAAGFCAVKVLAPQLLPLATDHNVRFLGTPRLHSAPAAMGYPARSAETVNAWPQPFA